MAGSSKTVCLRAFNEDRNAANPWESAPPPPPAVPKRMAWPGGKIVSNKDEALASFLRRKLDQGQTLTPEQMTMLEKMVDPSVSAAEVADSSYSARKKKRKNRESLGGGGGRNHVGARKPNSTAEARKLLFKLENKVARASDPVVDSGRRGGGLGGFAPASRRKLAAVRA